MHYCDYGRISGSTFYSCFNEGYYAEIQIEWHKRFVLKNKTKKKKKLITQVISPSLLYLTLLNQTCVCQAFKLQNLFHEIKGVLLLFKC